MTSLARRGSAAVRLCAVLVVLVGLGVVAGPQAEAPPPLRDVLARAGEAAEQFGADLQGVVARERYLQTVRPWTGRPPWPETHGDAREVLETRRLVSSLLLVHDAATPWQLHRDVVTVDDAPVADRQDRLSALFAGRSGDPRQRLREITEESARYNLGHVTRTINIPTFPLLVVHPTHRDRFRFSDGGRSREAEADLRQVAFREKGRPRLVRGARGQDVELRGLLVIDERTGELVRATVTPHAGHLRSALKVSFARVAGLSRRVPVRLREWYWVDDVPERDRYVEGDATYDEFRRYTTEVSAPVVR
jgi:hypothetical protein